MIGKIKSKALKRLMKGDESKIDPDHIEVLSDVLAMMHSSSTLQDVALPGMRLHPWSGVGKNQAKTWSLDVSGNCRILFKFEKKTGLFYDVVYEDPH